MSEPKQPSFLCFSNGRTALMRLSLVSMLGSVISPIQHRNLYLIPFCGLSVIIEIYFYYAFKSMRSERLKYANWIMSFSLAISVIVMLVAPIYIAVEFAAGYSRGSFLEAALGSTLSSDATTRKIFAFSFAYLLEAALFFSVLFSWYRISIVRQLLEIAKYRENVNISNIPKA